MDHGDESDNNLNNGGDNPADNHREPTIRNVISSLLLPFEVGNFNDRLPEEDRDAENIVNGDNQPGQTKDQDGRISAALFVGNLLAFIIAALVANIMADKESVKIGVEVVEVILLIFIALGILAMLVLWCIRARPRWLELVHGQGYQDLDNEQNVSIPFKFSLIGVWIFGVGSIAFLALKSAADILCDMKMSKAWDCTWAILDPIRCSLQTVFLLIQMAFLSFFNSQQLRRNAMVHYLLLLIMAANFSIWFYTILNDSDLLFGSWESRRHCILKTGQNASNSDFEKCKNQTTDLYQIVESSEPYLYPFVLEYSILSVGLLLGMWSRTGVQQPARETAERRPNCLQNARCSVTLSVSIFFNVLFVLLSGLVHDKEYYTDLVESSYVCSIIYTSFFLIFPLWFGFYRLQVDGEKDDTVSNVKEYILLISGFGILVFAYFSLIAAVCVDMARQELIMIVLQ